MAPNTPVIECKGRLMLASQYKAPNKKQITPPYVFHYHVGDVLEICLDGKTYGNDGRFCRRSATYNAELKHVLDKGSLHLFIVAVKSIEKNQEIFLPLDNEDSTNSSPLPSINADLREIKKPLNGLLNGPNSTSTTTGEENAPLKKKKKVKVMLKPASNAKTERKIKKEPKTPKIKSEPNVTTTTATKTREIESPPTLKTTTATKVKKEEVDPPTPPPPMVNGIKTEEEDEEDVEPTDEDLKDSNPMSPLKNGPKPNTSPSKMGLPDSSGKLNNSKTNAFFVKMTPIIVN